MSTAVLEARAWQREYAEHEFDPAYEVDAFTRARSKLDALASEKAPQAPLGRLVWPVVGAFLFGGLPAAFCFGWAISLYAEWSAAPGAAISLAVCGGFAVWLAVALFKSAKPSTPKRALKIFFKSVARGRTNRARRMVVTNDLDDFPRYHPEDAALERKSVEDFRFESPDDFKRYWCSLLRYHTAPYCLATLNKVRIRQVGPDVCVAEFSLRLIMNTQLWWLLILVLWPAAIAADLATRKIATVQLRKILVRTGDEWKLFNGAWQGFEEDEPDWIEP